MTQPTTIPPWKFWHPLSLWKVFGVFLLTNLVFTVVMVAMREGLGWPVPEWTAGGFGGLTAVLIINVLVRRAKAKEPAPLTSGDDAD